MTTRDIVSLKQALAAAGVEIYRSESDTLHIAERVRLHFMDAGVRVRVADQQAFVGFTARSQRSDFPHATADSLFERVREGMRGEIEGRGYSETAHQTIEVKDPVDDSSVLDVWHEVTFERPIAADDDIVAEVRWALGLDKYISQ